MAPSIGLNLRVTGYKHQGGRKYMEDEFGVAYQQTADEKDLEYAFFGIFDGHGGREAALFAKEHLMDFIVRQKGFWAEDDDSVLKAIHEGFIQTHYAMWKELEKWPKTASGLPSTAGTTASIAFIRRGKIFIGHVGDSAIILGSQDPDNPDIWRAEPLTRDHKPESLEENERITQCGGKVICKSGVPRVVWNRPKMGHKGPVRRSTHIDEIPFLAVARSLGDLWSYNSEENVFVVSPEPDIRVYPVDISRHRCLVLGTDGAWNMLTPQNAISTVCMAEKANEQHMLNPIEGKTSWINPSKQLVDCAIDRWNTSKLRADNTSVVTVMLDPPGPPRAQVLKNRKRELAALNAGRELPNPMLTGDRGSVALVTNTTGEEAQHEDYAAQVPSTSAPKPAISITSRCPNAQNPSTTAGHSIVKPVSNDDKPPSLIRENSTRRGAGRLNDSSSVPPLASAPSPSDSPTPADRVQCNEISSSEDGDSTAAEETEPELQTVNQSVTPEPTASTSSANRKSSLKGTPQSLSRELNALQLSSGKLITRGSTRSRTASENCSDAENDARLGQKHNTRKKKQNSPLRSSKRQQDSSLVDVEQRCQELNAKIEMMERKVATKAAQLNQEVKSIRSKLADTAGKANISSNADLQPENQVHYLRSSDPSTPSRLLRSRMPVITTPLRTPCAVKRKRTDLAVEALMAPGGKSPRTVASQKPVVTRSRHARVLRLKK
jgi:protein phosphatase 1D